MQTIREINTSRTLAEAQYLHAQQYEADRIKHLYTGSWQQNTFDPPHMRNMPDIDFNLTTHKQFRQQEAQLIEDCITRIQALQPRTRQMKEFKAELTTP